MSMNIQCKRADCWQTPAFRHRHHSRQPGSYTSDGVLLDSASCPFFQLFFFFVCLFSSLAFKNSQCLDHLAHFCKCQSANVASRWLTLELRPLQFCSAVNYFSSFGGLSSPDCRSFFFVLFFFFFQRKNSIRQFAFQQV